jgi:hypothetical protein
MDWRLPAVARRPEGAALERAPHRKKRRQGKLRPAPVLPEVAGTSMGPAMAALPSDKHRAFVLNLYEIEPGWGCNAKAARLAGFGTDTSSTASMATIGWRLATDERVLAAIAEEDKKRIRASAPRALSALQRVVENPDHRDHIRGVAMVLDRVHPVQTHHQMHVMHEHIINHDDEAVDQLRIMLDLGVPEEKLLEAFGYSGLGRYRRKLAERDAGANGDRRPHRGSIVTAPNLIDVTPVPAAEGK